MKLVGNHRAADVPCLGKLRDPLHGGGERRFLVDIKSNDLVPWQEKLARNIIAEFLDRTLGSSATHAGGADPRGVRVHAPE